MTSLALEMPRRADGRASAFLHAGQFFVSAVPAVVTTILGSCVSVCLFDPMHGVGGLNHYLLDYPIGGRGETGRFGSLAIPALVERLCAAGAKRRNIIAKIFGGASIIGGPARTNKLDLGSRNVELALGVLERERIDVLQSEVRGSRGRKLLFQTDDGTCWVKEL